MNETALIIGGCADGRAIAVGPRRCRWPFRRKSECVTDWPDIGWDEYELQSLVTGDKQHHFYIRTGISAADALEALINSYQCRSQAVECERCGHEYKPSHTIK